MESVSEEWGGWEGCCNGGREGAFIEVSYLDLFQEEIHGFSSGLTPAPNTLSNYALIS